MDTLQCAFLPKGLKSRPDIAEHDSSCHSTAPSSRTVSRGDSVRTAPSRNCPPPALGDPVTVGRRGRRERQEARSGARAVTRSDADRDEYADWEPPRGSDEAVNGDAPTDADELTPAALREPLARDRLRDRLGVTPRQWYVIETFLLVAPYPVFVLVYVTLEVNETAFLAVTLVYSLAATYVGLLS